MRSFSKNKKINNTGFTALEIIVVIAIFVFIASVILIRFSVFNSQISTTNLAYDIALSIREAQSFAVNVRATDHPVADPFNYAYGIRFSSLFLDQYDYFVDLNDNKRYSPNELIETYSLLGGNKIKNICGTTIAGELKCTNSNDFVNLLITFKRPNLDAVMKGNFPAVIIYDLESAYVDIESPKGEVRRIEIINTGQISVITP